MGTAVSEETGTWVEPEVNYVDPERRFCDFCGRPIARRYWATQTTGGEARVFCSPEHADQQTTYLTEGQTQARGTHDASAPGT